MNKVYRIVWSHARQAWVVACELARGVTKGKSGSRKRKALVAGTALMAALSLSQASAANYVVSTEVELHQAIIAANADGDATSTITLTANIEISGTTAFATVSKPITIDTGSFVLTGANTSGLTVPGTSLIFVGGPLVVNGNLQAGDAGSSASRGAGGTGLDLNDGSVENHANVSGGAGGWNSRSAGGTRASGIGGDGASLTNSSIVNHGQITGGGGGQYDSQFGYGAGAGASGAAGGTGLRMVGGSLNNQGQLVGGKGGAVINNGSGANSDNLFGGAGGIGASLSGGTHSNSGVIVGGDGGSGSNQGGSAGAGAGGAGLRLENGGTLVNQVGGSIRGGNGVASVAGGGPVSNGGAGATVAGSTLENRGAITGGNGTTGGAGIVGSGGANIINIGSIASGGTPAGVPNYASVEFINGNNRLEIRSGSSLIRPVVAKATDTLALGGATSDSFDVSQIGAALQFRGFGLYEKTGVSTWTLTGSTAVLTPWTLREGILSVSAEGNLGAVAGGLAFDGGTLQVTGAGYAGTGRTMSVTANNGAIDVVDAANVFTVSSVVVGSGGLTKLGDGTLTFTADNTYAGGTTLSAGTLQLDGMGVGGECVCRRSGSLVFHPADRCAGDR